MSPHEALISTGRHAKADARGLAAWCFYDWANSAFPTVVSTFVFAAYFARAVAEDANQGTFLWGQAQSAAGLAVALLAPILGAIADQGGRRKPWLAAFTIAAVAASALLWLVRPDPAFIALALALVALGTLAMELAGAFYNAMLPAIAPPAMVGRISGWGWGLGYAGGLACLVAALVMLVQADPPPFGLDREAAEHVRATGPLVGLWMAVFALPLFLWTPDAPGAGRPPGEVVRAGLGDLLRTLRGLPRDGDILRFLVAHMLYADGLVTLFAFGGIYAAGTFGMSFEDILKFGIALNVTAGLGAAGFAWMDDKVGAKPTIVVSLLGLLGFGAAVLFVDTQAAFWWTALALGIFVGPAQAASRSLMARLTPPERQTEMFGLYALSGKATAFLGPAVLGWATLLADSQRAGMATILVFWLVGLAILLTVREPRRTAERHR